jgi:Uma2 family endonuclease
MSQLSLRFDQIIVPPGQEVWLRDIDWATFEGILEALGDTRGARLAYQEGVLEIMSPLARHEDDKGIISDLVKVLLEEIGTEFRALGSTTFKRQDTGKAVEPDDCFYIEHEAQIRGLARIDLERDPPPDLVLEVDLTSRTHLDIYAALGIPEVWRCVNDVLYIHILWDDRYAEAATSPHFPGLHLREAIPRCLADSRVQGRNTAVKAFRTWAKGQLGGTTMAAPST